MGGKVTWTKTGSGIPHTTTGATWDSGVLAAGGSYIVTFNSEGQFAYVCTIHASMKGTITVICP